MKREQALAEVLEGYTIGDIDKRLSELLAERHLEPRNQGLTLCTHVTTDNFYEIHFKLWLLSVFTRFEHIPEIVVTYSGKKKIDYNGYNVACFPCIWRFNNNLGKKISKMRADTNFAGKISSLMLADTDIIAWADVDMIFTKDITEILNENLFTVKNEDTKVVGAFYAIRKEFKELFLRSLFWQLEEKEKIESDRPVLREVVRFLNLDHVSLKEELRYFLHMTGVKANRAQFRERFKHAVRELLD